jgi:hypothetical protein
LQMFQKSIACQLILIGIIVFKDRYEYSPERKAGQGETRRIRRNICMSACALVQV